MKVLFYLCFICLFFILENFFFHIFEFLDCLGINFNPANSKQVVLESCGSAYIPKTVPHFIIGSSYLLSFSFRRRLLLQSQQQSHRYVLRPHGTLGQKRQSMKGGTLGVS